MQVSISEYKLGDRVYSLAMLRDITEKKQAELKLMESEEKLQALFAESVFPIGVSIKGRHIIVNPAYLDLFGYKNFDELKDIPIMHLIAPSERDRILNYVERRARGENVPGNYETIGLKKDETEFPMEVSVSTYTLNNEIYTSAFFNDITKRKIAEEEIKSLKDKLQAENIYLRKTIKPSNLHKDIVCPKNVSQNKRANFSVPKTMVFGKQLA